MVGVPRMHEVGVEEARRVVLDRRPADASPDTIRAGTLGTHEEGRQGVMLKVLVTGSRNWTDVEAIRRDLSGFPADTLIIHGAARGADAIANRVAKEYGYSIARFPARWSKDGRKAVENSRHQVRWAAAFRKVA